MAQCRRPRMPLITMQEPARCHLPLLEQKLPAPGSSSTAVPLGDFGPKPYWCIYSLHPGCHTFGNTRLRLPSIGFFITETPSTGVSFVASRTTVPGWTTCPLLCGCAGCGSRYLLPHSSPGLEGDAVDLAVLSFRTCCVLTASLQSRQLQSTNEKHEV